MTGCGDRTAELSPAVTLERHVDDVIAGLVGSDLRDVVLVGHSYSGMVITGVAERAADRLAALVFVDAFYPGHAESALDQMPATFQALFRQRAEDEGEGWRLPANDGLLDVWGLHEAGLRAWVRPRLTDWSLNCFTSAVDAPAMHRTEIRRSYLSANAAQYPAKAVFAPIADKAQADGCRIHRFDTGHDIMIEDPRKFADALLTTTV